MRIANSGRMNEEKQIGKTTNDVSCFLTSPQEIGFKKSVETQIQALDKFLHSKVNELQG